MRETPLISDLLTRNYARELSYDGNVTVDGPEVSEQQKIFCIRVIMVTLADSP